MTNNSSDQSQALSRPTNPETQQETGAEIVTWSQLLKGPQFWPIVVLSFGVWLHAADGTLIATLLPTAIADIGGHRFIHWNMVLYNVGSIVAGAAAAALYTRFNLNRALILSALVYAFGCLVSAVGPTMTEMLIGRLLQGMGGGTLVALTLITISTRYSERYRPRILAFVSAIWGMASFLGPLMGGIFPEIGYWRLGFWSFAAQALLYCAAVHVVLRSPDTNDEMAAASPVALQTGRLTLFAVAALLLASAGVDVDFILTPLLVAASLVLFVLFCIVDGRSGANRLFPVQFLSFRSPLGAGILAIMAFSAATIAFTLYGPVILNQTLGLRPLAAGYMIALESVAWSLGAVFVSGLTGRPERLAVLAGGAFLAFGPFGLALSVGAGSTWLICSVLALQGCGFGLCFGPIMMRIMANAPPEEAARTSGALMPLQTIAYTAGAAIAGLFASASGFSEGLTLEAAQIASRWVFMGFVPLSLIGFVALIQLLRSDSGSPLHAES